jgi:hypothetical protein
MSLLTIAMASVSSAILRSNRFSKGVTCGFTGRDSEYLLVVLAMPTGWGRVTQQQQEQAQNFIHTHACYLLLSVLVVAAADARKLL